MPIDLRADIREAGVDGKGLEGHAARHDDACPDATGCECEPGARTLPAEFAHRGRLGPSLTGPEQRLLCPFLRRRAACVLVAPCSVVCVFLLWCVGPAAAQPGSTTGTVTGLVLDQAAAPAGVAVRLSPILSRRSPDRHYLSRWQLCLHRRTCRPLPDRDRRRSAPSGDRRHHRLGGDDDPPSAQRATAAIAGQLALVLVTIILFGTGILAFRHHNIVHTTRELLMAQLENIETRLPLESASDPANSTATAVLMARIQSIKDSVPGHLGWIEWFFWSRGHEISGWVRLHEVERQLVAFLVPDSRVIERAVTTEARLRAINKPTTIAVADRLRLTLQQVALRSAAAGALTGGTEDTRVPRTSSII